MKEEERWMEERVDRRKGGWVGVVGGWGGGGWVGGGWGWVGGGWVGGGEEGRRREGGICCCGKSTAGRMCSRTAEASQMEWWIIAG